MLRKGFLHISIQCPAKNVKRCNFKLNFGFDICLKFYLEDERNNPLIGCINNINVQQPGQKYCIHTETSCALFGEGM